VRCCLRFPHNARFTNGAANHCADGEDTPVLALLQIGKLAQTLNDCVVVHHDERLVLPDRGNRLAGGMGASAGSLRSLE
jgi:hypothetical protein